MHKMRQSGKFKKHGFPLPPLLDSVSTFDTNVIFKTQRVLVPKHVLCAHLSQLTDSYLINKREIQLPT